MRISAMAQQARKERDKEKAADGNLSGYGDKKRLYKQRYHTACWLLAEF